MSTSKFLALPLVAVLAALCLSEGGCGSKTTDARPEKVETTASAYSPAPDYATWLIALCKPSDDQTITSGRDYNFYNNMFFGAGTGSVEDYWWAQSYHRTTLAGSVLTPGWVDMGMTRSQVLALAGQNRGAATQACITQAIQQYNITQQFYNYIAVFNGQVAMGSDCCLLIQNHYVTGVIMDALTPETGVLHEMGHGFGLDHSYNDQGGEYGDNYDVMSFWGFNGGIHVYPGNYCVPTGGFFGCDNGPGLNAYTRWQLGWLQPSQRQMWWPATAGVPVRTQNVTLGARNEPATGLPQLLYIPASSAFMYTVEWIDSDNYDLGTLSCEFQTYQPPRTPANTLVIHKINYGDQHTYLVTASGGAQTAPGTPFYDSATGVHIALTSTQGTVPTATVQVTVDSNNSLWWSGAANGSPPADANLVYWQGIDTAAGDFWTSYWVLGGYDPNVGQLAVCRAWYGGGVHLGKAAQNWCSFPWGGQEHQETNVYEVLIDPGANTTWVDGSNGYLPANALAAGFDGGNTLYVCRAQTTPGNWTPGKFIWGQCDVGYGGSELWYSTYQVLTVP